MRILLVLPAAEHVRVTAQRPGVPKRSMLRFSVLPLLTVAALTPPEHEVRIVDENVEPLDTEANVDVVGISFMTAVAPRAYAIARRFRERGKVVVGGGFHPTLCPDEASQHFDAIVVGDAEDSWPQVLRDTCARRLQRVYRANPACRLVQFATPTARRDLLGATKKLYATVNAVQTGRGCRHACRYCSVTAFHQRDYRRRPLPDVLAELRTLSRDFIFIDDNIIASREHSLALFRAMVPLRKRWVAQCPVEVADDPELLTLMRAAGCRGLFIGIETENQESLAAMGKEFNDSRQYTQRLAAIHRHGIGVVAGIIVGLDQDDVRVFERTLDFLLRNGIEAVQVNILTPLPGTPLFEDMRTAGRLTDLDWSKYDFRHVVFEPAGMTAQQLQAGADWLYAEFYRPARIAARFLRTLADSGWVPAWLGLKLNLTYLYDNRREGIAA